MMVQVFRYLPKSEAAVHMCLQPLTEKILFSFFLLSLSNISEQFFRKTHLGGDHFC